MRTITAIGFLVLSTALVRADDAADAAKKLEGTYTLVHGSFEGNKDHAKLKELKSVVIKDGTITIKSENRDDGAKFTVDPSKKPAEITLMTVNGNNTINGIFETKDTPDGLQLTLAFTHGGGAAPKDFKGEGDKTVMLVLLRKKEK
jgi:uncharacterized protein (TIGR03067 family)